jgi:hypothetical protein
MLDGNRLDYSSEMQSDSWFVFFSYSHSTHQVSIALSSSQTTQPTTVPNESGQNSWILPVTVGVIVAVILMALIVMQKKKARQ